MKLKKYLSIFLAVLMMVSMFPTSFTAYAVGEEKHSHTEECYAAEGDLLCQLLESEGHTHSEECYCPGGELICGAEETEGHAHNEACYIDSGEPVCGKEETEAHSHEAGCYCPGGELVCSLEESEGHTHSEDCYAKGGELICGLEETEPVNLLLGASNETVTLNNIVYTLDQDNLTAQATKSAYTKMGAEIGDIVVPDSITKDGISYAVTSIAEKAFYGKCYKTITIGANVQTIGKEAFGDSFDEITKIEFKGDKCQTIASDAFDWMFFSKNSQLIVNGANGCMDSVLAEVVDLAGQSIIYINSESDNDTIWLQQQIDNALDGEATVIEIPHDIGLTSTITVPKGKNIVLTDDGTPRTIAQYEGKTVEQLFIVNYGASLTFDGNLTFEGGTVNARSIQIGNIVNVSGSFYLKNAVITSNGSRLKASSIVAAVLVKYGAYFEMTGGSIEKFSLEANTLCAPVIVSSCATFNMTGGKITNNINSSRACSSGGVLVYSWNGDPAANMTLSGTAKISNNRSHAGGGGIYLIGNAEVLMTGGEINGNSTYSQRGGGVCVAGANGGAKADADVCRFTMDGGTISNNFSVNAGGGIYVNSNYVTLKSGNIVNNEAGSHGGGIYVSKTPFTLQIYDALVTENTASVMGGGLWFCPTGTASLTVTNGSAIYGNTANGAGDDFVSLDKTEGKTSLADRMLGGGAVEWYQDGGVTNWSSSAVVAWMQTGEVDSTVPRFDAKNPGERIYASDSSASFSLKAVVSDKACELAQSKARLIISGNTAQRGGGIGSNGTVNIGTPKGDYTLVVNKVWSENTPEDAKQPVTVCLKIGEYQLDSVVLNSTNNWQAEFTQLPDPQTLGVSYAIVEDPVPENFIALYPFYEQVSATGTLYFTVKNQYVETGNLTVSKTVSGSGADSTKEFTFTVTLDDTSISGTYGDMTFADGVATFTLKHGESKTATGLPAETTYTVSESDNSGYTVTVNGQSQTEATGAIATGDTARATFNNHKSGGGGGGGSDPDPAKVTITAEKTLDGQAPAGSNYSFVLKDESGNVIQTVQNNGGSIAFNALSFSKTGTFNYTISEVPGNDSAINYDTAVYKIIIEVTRSGDYKATVSYEKDGAAYTGTPVFANTTKPVDPDNPDKPDNPDQPTDPTDPVTPTDPTDPSSPDTPDNPDTPVTPDKPTRPIEDVPQTGDNSHIGLWIALACLSLLGMIATMFRRKRCSESRSK